ncbi:MAG: ATP-binding protein [Chloroflexi bacterium]|nr:ATP-binding protein [Chloroflexota bacterium]MCL5026650.1 ATP-binding protein [Chloroflexota bacterium]
MRSLRFRLMLASALIAVVGLVIAAIMVHQFTEREFQGYLLQSMGGRGMMGGRMTDMMWSMMGSPERAFLAGVNRALWLGGAAAVVVAAVLSWQVSRQITSPLRRLTAAAGRIAGGDLSERVDIKGGDELEMLAAAFNHMADSLEKNEEVRGQLVADIAHELRTPLAILQANIEAMQDGVVEPTPKRLGTLHEETKLLARLVTDLRDLSLAEAGQLPLELGPVDLTAVVRRTVEAVRPLAKSRSIDVVEDLLTGSSLVRADAGRVEQVLRNLLDNALRYSEAGGKVSVAIEARPVRAGGSPTIAVIVSDEGPGISEDDLRHVFDRFYRVDPSRNRATGGSGIGLSLVKYLVEAQGGHAWAKSILGQGSEFGFALPAAADIAENDIDPTAESTRGLLLT